MPEAEAPEDLTGGTADGLSIRLAPRLEEIAVLAEQVDAYGAAENLPPRLVYQLNLVLEELVANTITHGMPPGTSTPIEIRIERIGTGLRAEVIDQGIAFDPLSRAEPDLDAALEDRPIGGLGVHFIRTLMDKCSYHRSDGRNHFVMWKSLAGS